MLSLNRLLPTRLRSRLHVLAPLLASAALLTTAAAQNPAPAPAAMPAPAFDPSAIDARVDPCTDFYQFACGRFAAAHPIPADQEDVDQFSILDNANTERLHGVLARYAQPDPARTPNQQKIGDFYTACMNTDLIETKNLAPLAQLFGEIDRVTKPGLPYFAGELQRFGVDAFFGFGPMQDFRDSTQEIGMLTQGGLGLPERDYYTRTEARDRALREQYVAHVAKMLTLAGETAAQARTDAQNVLAFETKLAQASLTAVELRDPATNYHPMTMAEFQATIPGVPFAPFFEAIHAPAMDHLNVAQPKFFPALIRAILNTDLPTLHAYLRYHLLTTYAAMLPKALDVENFHFQGTVLYGAPEQRARWKRCTSMVDKQLGEALGQTYVEQYFPPESKAKTAQEVADIEAAMDRDLDTLDWMGPATRVKAKEKLRLVANKIGYPAHWRNYTRLGMTPDDAFGDLQRGLAFENDREMAKIGQPVDREEWDMSPPTVNAYYDPSMNDINFPAGILQPAFYDSKADLAVNYGHIGGVIGHELTHGFDDQGSQFDGHGNLVDWWTPEDKQRFEAKTSCLAQQYGGYTAIDDLKVNGKLTLGENTADNGGLLLGYLAYLDRAQKDGVDTTAKIDGYTGPQRFYIAWAQNWCENTRPETVRARALTDPHSPDHLRANGPVVNQPGFGAAFGCKAGSAMTPAKNCRVW